MRAPIASFQSPGDIRFCQTLALLIAACTSRRRVAEAFGISIRRSPGALYTMFSDGPRSGAPFFPIAIFSRLAQTLMRVLSFAPPGLGKLLTPIEVPGLRRGLTSSGPPGLVRVEGGQPVAQPRRSAALMLLGRKPQNRRFVLPACSAGILPAWGKLKETAGWKPALRLPGREQSAQKA